MNAHYAFADIVRAKKHQDVFNVVFRYVQKDPLKVTPEEFFASLVTSDLEYPMIVRQGHSLRSFESALQSLMWNVAIDVDKRLSNAKRYEEQ